MVTIRRWATNNVDTFLPDRIYPDAVDYVAFRAGAAQAGDYFDGGTQPEGSKDGVVVEAGVTIDLRPVTFLNYEQLDFEGRGTIAILADQLVAGAVGRLIVSRAGSIQTLNIYVTDGSAADLRSIEFRYWDSNDVITIQGSVGDDTISGTRLSDTIRGGDGNDRLAGGGGYSVLYGEAGNDYLVSQTGAMGLNQLYGGTGNDTYLVRDNPDVVRENPGEGIDRVISQTSYVLADNVERLSLSTTIASGNYDIDGTGNALANILVGNQGENRLLGRGGDDVLRGGAGQDFLSGGAGRDVFVYSFGDSGPDLAAADRITDFSFSDHDRIDLRLIDVTSILGSGSFTGTAGELRFALLESGQSLVEFDRDGDAASDMTILVNAAGQALHDRDFIL